MYEKVCLCLGYMTGSLLISVLGATLSAMLVLTIENKWDRRLVPALAIYWLFLLSWVPLTLSCMWKKTTTWEEIRHTRSLALVRQGRGKKNARALAR